MINQLLINLGEKAGDLAGAFLFPGEALLALFAHIAPGAVSILTHGKGELLVPFVMALLVWTFSVVLGLKFLRFCRHVVRQFNAIVLTLWYRTRMAISSLVMRITWRLRALLPRRIKKGETMMGPTIEFDDLDMAVMRTVSAKGPGFALSAPDLAEKFTLRPAQVQKSLDKLRNNKMLDSVIGSTDGFDNYRVSDSGLAYMAMLQRQQARQ